MKRPLLVCALLGTALATPAAMHPDNIRSLRVTQVAQLTGPGATTPTKAVDICGTDLGIPASFQGRLYLAFGDTFGYDGNTCKPFGPHWRSNVLGQSTDTHLEGGLSWSGWLKGTDGTAGPVIDGAHQEAFSGEQTKIPTAMIGLRGQLVLHYMSVHGFAPQGGVWQCNYSQFMTSKDGQSWTAVKAHVGEQGSNFNMLALSADAGGGNAGGGYVYILGTPCGRFGDAQLARVPAASLTDVSRWRYYTGNRRGVPQWSADPIQAADVMQGPIGEASLSWNAYLGRWTYSYLNERAASLELREAVTPWGPWSEARTLATASQYPQLYGAFSTHAMQRGGGQTVYFVMSRFGPYNTFLMRLDLSRNERP